MNRLVITGAGMVSAQGIGWQAAVHALRHPDRAAAMERAPVCLENDVEPLEVDDVLAVVDFDARVYLGEKGLRNFDRLTLFLIVAAKHALEVAGIKKDGAFILESQTERDAREGKLDAMHNLLAIADDGPLDVDHALQRLHDPDRLGLCLATAYGSLDAITELNRIAELETPRYINPSRFPNTVINSAAGYVSIWEGLRGPNTTVVDGNCGALNAVMNAETHMHCGRADAFLVGGGESLSAPFYLALRKLGLNGGAGPLVVGEGAALLCVESEARVRARGGKQELAEINGYGTAFEAPSSAALLVHASPGAVFKATRKALDDAGLRPDEIDVVCSAENSLDMIDNAEREGLQRIFKRLPLMLYPKRIFGETHGASGAFGMLSAAAWFARHEAESTQGASDHSSVTGGLSHIDSAGTKDAATQHATWPRRQEHALVLAIGYYGNVSAVVMSSRPAAFHAMRS